MRFPDFVRKAFLFMSDASLIERVNGCKTQSAEGTQGIFMFSSFI
jgi:hypothetical protein